MKKLYTLILLLLTGIPLAANAADIRVRVFERGGDVPLQNVAVCLGTSARLDQFGSAKTDGNGYVLFSEVPRSHVVVTASLAGYKSEQESMVTSNTSRMLVLSLSSGGGGTDCNVAVLDEGRSSVGLAVRRFSLNKGARSTDSRAVKLNYSVTGMATQFRASEQPEMEGADWQYYAAEPEFTLSEGAGLKRVYLQVRRHSTVNGATLETVSPVVQDTIRLR